MIETKGINSPNDVIGLFSGIKKFSLSPEPFVNQLSMVFRVVGKMRALYLLGPLKESSIKSMADSWDKYESVKSSLSKRGIYGILVQYPNEGVTIWGLILDSSIDLDKFNSEITPNFKQRLWASAYSNSIKILGKSEAPFAISFIASITERAIPFFGRVAWGTAVVNDVVSLTQIPLMNNNKDQYFTWSFVPKKPITESQLYSTYGKGGGEQNYKDFVKFRTFLEKECEALNSKGEYSFSKGQDSPLDRYNKTDQPKDPSRESRLESLNNALKYKYHLIHEDIVDRADPDFIGQDKASFPSGEPYINNLKTSGTVPILGALY